MTNPKLDREGLRALAEKATPGPWQPSGDSIEVHRGGTLFVAYRGNGTYDDAAFIAAANPTTVLALLDENERMRAAVSVMSIALERIAGGNPANTNSETAKDMSEWSHCVAVVAMCNPAVVESRAALSPTQPEEVK